MPTFLDPIVTITPASGSWQDVDVSAHCPAGTTGVAICVTSTTIAARDIGWRKKGSADDRYSTMQAQSFMWAACGVDANRVLQLYVGASVAVYLIGYFGGEAVFFTNAVDKSLGVTGSWQTVDVSGDVAAGDVAQLAFLDVRGLSTDAFGVRKKGSGDNWRSQSTGSRGAFVGCDANNQFECYIGNVSVDIFLNGYLRAGATMAINASVVTPAGAGAYEDLPALPAGTLAGVYQVYSTSTGTKNALRMKGAAHDVYLNTYRLVWGIAKCDANRVVEAKVSSTADAAILLLGYITSTTPAITNLSAASGYVGESITITGIAFGAAQGTGSVTFNGTAATITSWTDTSIVCTVPVGATTGDVVVTNDYGYVSGGTAYTVKDLPIATAIGSGCPGDGVTIDGTDFGAVQGTVAFDVTAASIVSWANTQIVVTVPTGAVDCTVTVTNGDGKACTVAFTLGNCGGAASTPEAPIHTDNPIGAGPNIGLGPVR